MAKYTPHLKDSRTVTVPTLYWSYEFPNGHKASVIPDPHRSARPFRFEVLSTDPADLGRGGAIGDLSTEQVEAKLAKVAALPPADEN